MIRGQTVVLAFTSSQPRNALHIAIGAVNGIEFLVHIANAAKRAEIEQLCRQAGFEPPLICSPEELSEK
jgi:hypothetical protein